MAPPRVTILIPNHNHGHFVGRAVTSCLEQTRPADEIIVVDDGSTDHSREVLASFGPAIHVLHQNKQGQTAALANGFHLSTGDWILTLDADDWLSPRCLEQLVPLMKDGVSWIYYRLATVDHDGRVAGFRPAQHESLARGMIWPDLARGVELPLPPESGNCFARRVFQLHPLPLPPLAVDDGLSADLYLQTHAAFLGEAAAVDEPLGFYRLHTANNSFATMRKVEKIRSRIRAWEQLASWIHEQAAARGLATGPDEYVRRRYFYWRFRLVSFLHDADTHPHTTDTLGIILVFLLRSIWRPVGRPRTRFLTKVWRTVKSLLLLLAPPGAASALIFELEQSRIRLGWNQLRFRP
jgi:glycosyltransferase involved in cell wall biosynthesis